MADAMVMESGNAVELNKTGLFDWHQSHGAKMTPFSGWDMPLQYTKVLEEHHAVREKAGLFDISHMGLLVLQGAGVNQVLTELDALVGQDLSTLVPGKAVYTHLLLKTGGVIDDVIIYSLPEAIPLPGFEQCLLICNAGTTQKVMAHLNQQLSGKGISVMWLNNPTDTDGTSFIALQGPQFKSILTASPNWNDSFLPGRFWIAPAMLWDVPVLISRTGYSGEDGVEIIIPNAHITTIWEKLVKAGATPIGLAARDTLRLEAAYPLYSHELADDINPLEAGLGWAVKLQKPAEFWGKDALNAWKASTEAKRRLLGFRLDQKVIPRHGDEIRSLEGELLGVVTSGSISPSLGYPIGLGFVTSIKPYPIGGLINIAIRGKLVTGTVVERPFYKSAR